MSQPLTEADIIFPHLSNTPNLSSTLSSLRRSTLSIHNRLSSISSDSTFVISVAEAYNLPLVANERCGSWYIPPSVKFSSVYFKSTDGHMGEWGFSLRRLNLQLLDVVEKRGGAVIVDSTRRGKSMPDALSKTVPIWCAVINKALFGEEVKKGKALEELKLFTPPNAVGESEHAQIEKRLDGFVQQFLDICRPNIPQLRSKIRVPLRPIWITQQSSIPDAVPSFPDFHPIVLCTASRRVRGAEVSENGYIQGAADDHEAWAHGLTPTLFWKHQNVLMNTSEEDAPALIEKLISEKSSSEAVSTMIKPTTNLYISLSEKVDVNGFGVVISCTPEPLSAQSLKEAKVSNYLHLKCQSGKLGSRDLRNQLPRLLDFFKSHPDSTSSKVLVCCPTGKDLSVGTALAVLCLYVDDEGHVDTSKRRAPTQINKGLIKQRLSWITTSNPALNPSRATLQSVNAVLLQSQDPKALPQATRPSNSVPELHTNLPIRESRPVSRESEVKNEQEHEATSTQKDPDVASVIFNRLETTLDQPWKFTRTLKSALPTHPSGTVTGTATFTLCSLPPTSPPTLLYAEEGEFATETGLRFTARRKYVYQLKDAGQTTGVGENTETENKEGNRKYIAVHFFDDEKLPRAAVADGVGSQGQGIGGLFVEMDTLQREEGGRGAGDGASSDGVTVLAAKNREQHLCAADLYTASWRFGPGMAGGTGGGDAELWWEVKYDVQGPKKGYVSRTRYARV